MRPPRWKWLAGLLVALGVVGAVAATVRAQDDGRAQRVRDAISWDASCADVVIVDTTGRGWPQATKRASIRCEHLGPAVLYARFERVEDLREDLLRDAPSAPVCIAGREVLVDLLDPGQFAPLCRRFEGDLIDGVSTLPDTGSGTTIEEIDRSVDAQIKREAAAQAQALRRYWRLG